MQCTKHFIKSHNKHFRFKACGVDKYKTREDKYLRSSNKLNLKFVSMLLQNRKQVRGSLKHNRDTTDLVNLTIQKIK